MTTTKLHPVLLSKDSDGYVNPSECTLVRIYHVDLRDPEDSWEIDAAKLDSNGNVVGYTEEAWTRPSFQASVDALPVFVREVVPHLAENPLTPTV